MIGEGGVALIKQRVSEMGYIFHDRRVDHGIDGEIELVSPDGDALNLVVMVQSKASNRSWSYETDDSFQWTADAVDLDYWLGGNAPVIVVLSRPSEGLAWWVDIRAEFSDPRRRAERTVTVDKHAKAFDRSAAGAIMRCGVPRDSGIYLRSPPRTEIITTNFMPVSSFPSTLYTAPATVRDYAEGWDYLRTVPEHAPGWLLREGMLLSFANPRDSPLSYLCDGGVEEHGSEEWADGGDIDTRNTFADLLRRTLVSDHSSDLQWHQSRRHLHFRPTANLKPRVVRRGTGKGRTVFGPHYSKNDPEKIVYYSHAALGPRFRRIDGRWYCQLGVDYCFTRDGRNESSFADSLLAGIKRLDRHPAVRSWTQTWESFLLPDLLTADAMLILAPLLTYKVERGIDDNWWGPAPASAINDPQDTAGDEALDPLLKAAGIDENDLLSLLEAIPEAEPAADEANTRTKTTTASRRGARQRKRGA